MLSNYEISDDLSRVHIKCIERKYGGRLRAHNAASKIQRAYRHYRLFQQWKQVVSQAPNSARLFKTHTFTAVGSVAITSHPSEIARGIHLRKLAQSQPSLKYFPLTSLTAQLRAERSDSNSPLCSPTTSAAHGDRLQDSNGSNKLQSVKGDGPSQQPYDYLISPRLLQKRLNFTIYQKQAVSADTTDGLPPINSPEPTTIVLYDSEHEEELASSHGLLSVTDVTHFLAAATQGYHRSASPRSRRYPEYNNNERDRLPTAEQNGRNHDDFRQNFIQSNWKPRHSDGSIIRQGQNVQFDGRIFHMASQHHVGADNSGTQFQLVPAVVGYNANSLPRVSKKHAIVHGELKLFGDESAQANDSHNSTPIHNRTSSFTRPSASPSSLTTRRAASRDQINNIRGVDIQNSQSDHHSVAVVAQSRANPRAQMRGWRDQYRRRLYRIALNFFNKKPDRGVQLLIAWGFVENNSRAIARVFLERRGLSKQKIGEFLGTIKSSFHFAILQSFIDEIPMYDMDIDKALRQLLVNFRLPGEAQKIDHIMQVFAARYRLCNPERFPPEIGSDTVYILAFAIIMLNTDLHTPSLKDSKRMKLEEFIKNICGIKEGQLLDRRMLQAIYERVKEYEFRTGADHVTQVMKVDQSIIGKDKPKLVEPHRRLICYCRLNQIPDPNKKQATNVHQREVFLFNDLMLVSKIFSKRKSVGQYTLRYWTPLIGIRVESFQNNFYNFGVVISCPDGQNLVFNAKNADDQLRFMADIRESVLESTEMEQLRIELELGKQNANGGIKLDHKATVGEGGKFPKSDRLPVGDEEGGASSQRDSGLSELDRPSSSSAVQQQLPDGNQDDSTVSADSTAVARSTARVHMHQVREKMPITTFNSTNSVTSAFSTSYSTTSENGSNGGTPSRRLPQQEAGNTTPTAVHLFDRYAAARMTPGSVQNHCTSSSSARSASNGVLTDASAAINNSASHGARRLSFNSLDSGMVEESVDYPT